MADYGQNDGVRHDPWAQAPYPPRGYTIHQYSSAGGLDRNYSETMDWAGGTTPPEPEKPRYTMASFLIHEVSTGKVWVVSEDGTKVWVRNPDALAAATKIRSAIKFTGGWADDAIHRTDESDGLWANLLGDARDVDGFNSGGGGTGGGGPLTVTLQGVATPQ
jgi:hypothetical protein